MINATKTISDNALNKTDTTRIERMRDYFTEIRNRIGRKIIGQEAVVEQLLISFFSGGHTLFIGVPGLAKTLLVRTLSEVMGLDYNRIQFTPDLMPSDITGTDIIGITHEGDREFNFLPGPLFTNIVLADEINRTPPKTQAALLEAMEEYTIHVGGKKYDVPKPFFVLATQNPIEQEGTYQLPAAALDRFLFNIFIDYPDNE
ncbi:MAG: AAA family ATPase, partial [Planctomycetes bacterium]|nr:AAA family ATPase [Planctomycetota bacterium]